MWCKLTVMLFLLVLAQTANASPLLDAFNDIFSSPITHTQTEQQSVSTFDHDEAEDTFNLSRLNRLSPSFFSAVIQTTPNYVLVIEFFKIKLTAGLFKNLVNPPVMPQWFTKLSHNTNSSRLSGWKDGNFLYSSKSTYHN